MRVQRTSQRILTELNFSYGHGVNIFPDKPDDFFDDWLSHGQVTQLGINERGVRYVISSGDVYYSLDDVLLRMSGKFDIVKKVHQFAPGISGDQIKDLQKMISQEAS